MGAGGNSPYGGQPVDITVHVVREGGQGASSGRGIPGTISEVSSSGQRNPPRSSGGGAPDWDKILGGGKGAARGSMGPEAPQTHLTKMGASLDGLFGLAKKWMPMMLGVTTVAGIIKKSTIFGSTMDLILEAISMIMDIVLMPLLVPLIMALAPLMEPLGRLMELMIPVIMPIGKVVNWIVGFVMEPFNKILSALSALLGGDAKGAFKALGGGKGILDTALGIASPGSRAILHGISAVAKKGVGGVLSGVKNFLGFESGIPYVPGTMPAMLHRGERVLTARENSGGGGNMQMFQNKFDIHVANNVDASLLDQRIVERLETRLGNRYRRK